jgi:hypothetical protein
MCVVIAPVTMLVPKPSITNTLYEQRRSFAVHSTKMPPSKKTQKRSAKFLDAQYSHVKKKRKLVQKIKKRNVEQTEKKKSREEKQAIKDSEDAAIHAALPKPQYFSESTAEVDLEKFLTKSFGDADEENDNDSNEEDAPLAASDSEEEPTEPVAADLEADQEDSGSGEGSPPFYLIK